MVRVTVKATVRVTPVWNEKSNMLRIFGTFAHFGEIVRIQVEYQTSRDTQGYAVRMYGIDLKFRE